MIPTTYKSEEIGQMLKGIESTQESIVNTSTAFLKLGKEGFSNRLSEDWISYFRRFSGKDNFQKRQAMLYLANDILQKCKYNAQNTKDFLDIFRPILLEAVKITVDQRQDELKAEFSKIFQIWRDRKIYPKDFLKDLQASLAQKEKFEPVSEEVIKNTLPESAVKIPSELLDFLEAEKEMNRWMQNEEEERSKLMQMLQGNIREEDAKARLEAFKKAQDFKHKYRTTLLTKLCELLRLSDVEHTKLNHLLKKSTALLEDLNKYE